MVFDRPAVHTVNGLIRAAVEADPDAPFLDFSGQLYSYGRLDAEVTRLARGLHALGVGHGDRVVTVLDNGPDAVIAWFAVNRLGAVNVPVNTAYRGEFLRHQVADAGAAVAVVEQAYLERLAAVADGMPELRHVLCRATAPGDPVPGPAAPGPAAPSGPAAPGPAAPSGPAASAGLTVTPLDAHRLDTGPLPSVDVAPRDLAALIYTSGTTGPSKGCMCSHNYLVDQGVRLGGLGLRTAEDVVWTPLPLFHIFAIATVLDAARLRATASISPRFSVSAFWPEVERTRATVVNLLGSMGVMLANAPDTDVSKRCHGQIRSLLAVPFPDALKQTWRDRFGVKYPGANVYGQTEAGSMITAAVDLKVPDGSAGRRNDTLDVRIFDEHDVECPPGVVGEIVVRPNKPLVMFSGFWNRPESSWDLAANYWHHTGDLGRFDADGFFYFVDRQKDYLRRRGENISSFEVEIALMGHEQVAEAAVHAVFSDVTEDDVKATVVLAEPATLTPAELVGWAADHVPKFALPRYVEFRDELPKNPVGRVLKYQLRDEGVTPTTWDRERS
jgi:crotonobetaine/carnitine-CoA ligase